MFETAVNKLTFLERGLGVSANRHAFSVYFGSTGVLSFRKYEHQNSFDRRFEDQQRKYQFGGAPRVFAHNLLEGGCALARAPPVKMESRCHSLLLHTCVVVVGFMS